MDKEGKFWVSLILGTILFVLVSICVCVYFNYKHDVNMAKVGYEEVTVLGYDYPVWQKAE